MRRLANIRHALVGNVLARLLSLGVVQYIAWRFGANTDTDAVFLAMAVIVFGGEIARLGVEAAVVPQLVRLRQERPEVLLGLHRRLSARLLRWGGGATLVIAGIGLASALLADVSLLRSMPARLAQLAPLALAFPIIAIDNAMVVAARRFLISGVATASGSAVVLLVTALFAPALELGALPLGYCAGYAVQALLLRRRVRTLLPDGGPDAAPTSPVSLRLREAIPVFVGSVVVSLNPVIDRLFAAGLDQAGAVTILELSSRVFNAVVSFTTSSLGGVLLAHWSLSAATVGLPESLQRLKRDFRVLLPLLLAGSAVLYAATPVLIRVLFHRGSFTAADVALASDVARTLAIALTPLVATSLLARFIYAQGGTGFALVSAVVAVAVNLPANYMLSRIYGLPGIALATAAVYLVTAATAVVYIARMQRQPAPAPAT